MDKANEKKDIIDNPAVIAEWTLKKEKIRCV